MSLHLLGAAAALTQLDAFDSVIDARSESEFALDHLPGAINWPTLHDAERQLIGTLYVQVSQFEAKKRGAALAARNIAAHIERELLVQPKGWRPLAYCWRGGKRSGALALILDQIGFRVTLLEGGYKAFRAALVADIAARVAALDLRVVCGSTGSGKTRLLHALAACGAQVLDLEALANHRSSVVGAVVGLAQPSHTRFDTLIWDALRRFDPARPVFIESESKKVGNVALPLALVDRMRHAPCLNLRLPHAERVALLLEDYDCFLQDTDYFFERLDVLATFRGKTLVQSWKDLVHAGQVQQVVSELLTTHYDPGYRASMPRNFLRYAEAAEIEAKDRSAASMLTLARGLLGQ
ncbi:MAG: tRNA 2-selenouridine(34) synthase MnmH [Rhodoferax sp.]